MLDRNLVARKERTLAIHFLPPELRERIAAGEVVERPAAVVKELIENALDARASRIFIDLRGGGRGAISVSDDGVGIPPDELSLAVARHATSKIATPSDLQGVATLGFRGEALASIAAISELTLISAVDSSGLGASIVVRGGAPVGVSHYGGTRGTTVVVRDLFFNLPGRRATPLSRETSRIADLVSAYALLHSGIRWRLTSHGETLLETSGDGLTGALIAVFGHETARRLLPVANRLLEGSLSPPGMSRSDRRHLVIGINGRPVHNALLSQAVERAYRSLLPRGRFPFGVLDIEIDTADVDPNVHAAKLEVRLMDERLLAEAITEAAEVALARRLAAPAWPRKSVLGLANGQAAFGPEFELAEEPAGYGEEPPDLRLLRAVGQLDSAFVLATGPDGLYIIDQHRAHERILYDEMLCETVGAPPRLWADEQTGEETADLALAACKSAIKAGMPLDAGEQADLLQRLAGCDCPTTCPHGSPAILRFDRRFIRRQFGRR